jgi:anti-anti-sigma factor
MTDTENVDGFFSIKQNGNVTIVRLKQTRISTEQDIENFDRELHALIDSLSTPKLILDLSTVAYLTAASLGKLIPARKKLAALHGQLIICCIPPDTMDVFSHSTFRITETMDDALAAMA